MTLLYDIIPAVAENSVCDLRQQNHFQSWLELQVTRSDAVIAISQTVAQEFRDYLALNAPQHAATLPIGYFHLGSDLDVAEQASAELPPEIGVIFSQTHHVFLMVGSITPRKNHRFVLDAFERYWAQGGTAHLVFVGHVAFSIDEFLRHLGNHPQNGVKLHHLTTITDAQLETIYRRSAALIMASSSEGFGLPLVEAMERGLPVLCSDIPIFHEVTAERADFFSLDSPDNLSTLIADFETRHKPGQPIPRARVKCLSWRESTQAMLSTMFTLLGRQ